MKLHSLTYAIAALAVVSAPLAAQGRGNGGKYDRNNSRVYDRNGDGRIDSRDQVQNGCSWYDINCNGSRTTRTTRDDVIRGGRGAVIDDSGWYQIGRDREGRILYERRVRTRDGRVVVQQARQERNGKLHIIKNKKHDNRDIFGRDDRRHDRDRDGDDDRDDDRWERDR